MENTQRAFQEMIEDVESGCKRKAFQKKKVEKSLASQERLEWRIESSVKRMNEKSNVVLDSLSSESQSRFHAPQINVIGFIISISI